MNALLFPGQGSQYTGMGKRLYDRFKETRQFFDEAKDIRDVMFSTDREALKRTNITQPAIYIHSIAAFELLKGKITPHIVAGHSLGEFSALCVAGVFSFKKGLEIVRKRGDLMAQAGEKAKGGMAAIIGMDIKKIEELISDIDVVVANINAPAQTVISGTIDGIQKAMEILKQNRARVIPLRVSGAFHSPLMKYALKEWREFLSTVEFNKPKIKVVQNVSAKVEEDPERIKENIIAQMTSPVKWVETLQHINDFGISYWYEVGPGKVLKGLLKKTLNLDLIAFDEMEEYS